MRKISALILGTLLCSVLNAQIIDVRDAHPGKDLTMEEAIFLGKGYARAYAWFEGGIAVSSPTPKKGKRVISPWDKSEAGYGFRTEEGSIIGLKDSVQFVIASGDGDSIVCGGTCMRNEFGFEKGTLWSPSGVSLAFYRKDQGRVTSFPLLDISSRTGSLESIRYPMNGMESEFLSVGIYNFEKETTVWLDVTDFTQERYITNLAWSPDEEFIYAQVLDREQHCMHLNKYSTSDGHLIRTVLTEENSAWVEPLDPIAFPEGRADVFIYRTDNRDGFRCLYLADTLGNIRRITPAGADSQLAAISGSTIFYTSACISPIENHLFRTDLRIPRGKNAVKRAKIGTPLHLTPERGWHSVNFNSDYSEFTDRVTSLNNPACIYARSTDGRYSNLLMTVRDPLDEYASCRVELGKVPSADGAFDNYYRLIYPKDFDPGKQYPLVVYVYGGPHSQLVTDSWLGNIRMWEMLMAQKGYFVYVQDNRGTQNRGAAFEKAINRRCGKAEMEDQMVGIRRLMDLPYIDSSRIGVHGWSYGGFMTISLMTNYPQVFKVGVAGGPVIDWKWYEIMYGERYMDNPATNPSGFEETSLVNRAADLKGKLLICQGAMDDTVVWQHSLSFIQACIDLGIPVDYFPYPQARHNVYGLNRIHLMDKVTNYFELYL